MGLPSIRSAPCPVCGALSLPTRKVCCQCGASLVGPVDARPAPLVALAGGASQPSAKERRRTPRRPVMPLTIGLECEGRAPCSGTLKDIGAGGIAVLTDAGLPIGASVSVLVPIDGRSHRADGVVRHCTPHGLDGGSGFVMGVEFISSVPPLSRLRTK